MVTLTTVPALAGAMLLGYTGLRHGSDSAMVRGSLQRSGLGSRRATEFLSRALPWLEVSTGMLVVGTFVLAPGLPFWIALAVQSGLFLLFAGYLVLLRIVAPDVACGCLGDDSPAAVLAVIRNVLIAGSGLFVLDTLIEAADQPSPSWSGRAGTVVLTVVLVTCYLLARSVRRSTGYRSVSGGV